MGLSGLEVVGGGVRGSRAVWGLCRLGLYNVVVDRACRCGLEVG